jgi:hypothetical protein
MVLICTYESNLLRAVQIAWTYAKQAHDLTLVFSGS